MTFVEWFYSLSYPDAVSLLLGERFPLHQPERKEETRKSFVLPPAHTDMRRVYAYLCKSRCISTEVVTHFAKAGLLYESAEASADESRTYHNGVFVGCDENGTARHGHQFGLYTEGKRFKKNLAGSDAKFSFHRIGTSNRLYVFEAPIDLLSFITLYPKDWRQHSYVALCGVSTHAMLHCLSSNPQLDRVVLCLDNDVPGTQAWERLSEVLQQKGYTHIGRLLPKLKDWNDDLRVPCEAIHQAEEPEPEESLIHVPT